MDVDITARHGNLSKQEGSWIRAKVDRLSRFSFGNHPAHVVVDQTSERSMVEMNIGALRGKRLSARAEATTLREAVSRAEAKLEKQLHKIKDRLTQHRSF